MTVAVDEHASTNADHAGRGLAYSCTINFTQRVGTPARVQINRHLVSNDVLKPVVLPHTFVYVEGRCQSVCCSGKMVSAQESLKKHQLCASCRQLSTCSSGNWTHQCWLISLKNFVWNHCFPREVQCHFLMSVKITLLLS